MFDLFLMMQFFIDVRKNVKHRANDASNNGTMDIAHPYSTPTSHLKSLSKSKFSKWYYWHYWWLGGLILINDQLITTIQDNCVPDPRSTDTYARHMIPNLNPDLNLQKLPALKPPPAVVLQCSSHQIVPKDCAQGWMSSISEEADTDGFSPSPPQWRSHDSKLCNKSFFSQQSTLLQNIPMRVPKILKRLSKKMITNLPECVLERFLIHFWALLSIKLFMKKKKNSRLTSESLFRAGNRGAPDSIVLKKSNLFRLS